jgi:hypothetical protein
MSKTKKLLYKSTLGVLIFLIVCTFLSKSIAAAIIPAVEVINPVRTGTDFTPTDSYADAYNIVVPAVAIVPGAYETTYVYITRERQGLFGPEHTVRLVEVQVIDSNNIYAALGGWNVTSFDKVVISSSRFLSSGEVVRVINE